MGGQRGRKMRVYSDGRRVHKNGGRKRKERGESESKEGKRNIRLRSAETQDAAAKSRTPRRGFKPIIPSNHTHKHRALPSFPLLHPALPPFLTLTSPEAVLMEESSSS